MSIYESPDESVHNDDTQATADAADLVRLATFFANHYPNGGTIRWTQNHLLAANDYASGWVDVILCDHLGAMNWNWIWTIVGPDDDEAQDADLWLLAVPYDVNIWQAWDGTQGWYYQEPCVITAPDAALSESALRLFSDLEPLPRPGWSSAQISNTLEAWCAEHLGRHDILFHFDPEFIDPALDTTIEQAVGLDLEVPDQLAENEDTTDPVMEFLTSLGVADAAALTEQMQKRLGEYLPRPHQNNDHGIFDPASTADAVATGTNEDGPTATD